MKSRDVGSGYPSHVGGEVVVTYGGIPTPVDGRVKAVIMAALRAGDGIGPRTEEVILAVLDEAAELVEHPSARKLTFDLDEHWFNWDVWLGRRRQRRKPKQQESEAA